MLVRNKEELIREVIFESRVLAFSLSLPLRVGVFFIMPPNKFSVAGFYFISIQSLLFEVQISGLRERETQKPVQEALTMSTM